MTTTAKRMASTTMDLGPTRKMHKGWLSMLLRQLIVVDFTKYAVDGEIPNLFVVFAGTGAEWSGTSEYHLVT